MPMPTDRAAQPVKSGVLTDLAQASALWFGDAVAQRIPVEGGWAKRTFTELHEAVTRVARVLHAAGVRQGDRVALQSATRAEWTVCDLAITRIGAICVPVYPTSTRDQIAWVLNDSGSIAVIAETAEQVALVGELADVRLVFGIDVATTWCGPLAELIDSGDAEATEDLPDVAVAEDDPFTIVYTSGTTGNPKGCVLSHRNISAVVAMLRGLTDLGRGDVVFAYLPLAHLLTRMLQLFCLHTGATIAYSRGDIHGIVGELNEVAPTHLPSVPTLFEKVYSVVRARVAARGDAERAEFEESVALGLAVRGARERGEPVSEENERRFAAADERLFSLVRAAFGSRIKQALTGGAPIAPEIVEFFSACGVPVYEAYGLTESSAVISANVPGAWRVGTVGRPVSGVEVRIAEDGEIQARSAGIFSGYWRDETATAETIVDGWLRTGDLGTLDEDGFLSITGRKKDIIITSAGKNLTPANIENDLRQTRFIEQAVMLGDRRPYPVALIALDEDAVTGAGIDVGDPAWRADARLRDLIADDVARVNASYSPPERIRDFAIVPEPFTIAAGELTPTFKVRRDVVAQRYADLVASLYS
ncbi:AMP-dependent synthetase/ligase [Haloechinothrix halophila]|uniref:AMP-dependent synthetase/ligase n=1 Tax=Haloechinothrix halophila TaxID=1069073 RepID=UPI00041AFEC3|nr:long-chain fatty acid--CoA ligase [Haloechinothrix halophila]